MKIALLIATFFSLNSFAPNLFAQTANIKDIPLNKDQDTNISISTGAKVSGPTNPSHQIVDEASEVVGEPETLSKDARVSWKKACDEWKKETKEMNKDNKIIALNCGQPKCETTENSTTTCKSQGKMKVKVKID